MKTLKSHIQDTTHEQEHSFGSQVSDSLLLYHLMQLTVILMWITNTSFYFLLLFLYSPFYMYLQSFQRPLHCLQVWVFLILFYFCNCNKKFVFLIIKYNLTLDTLWNSISMLLTWDKNENKRQTMFLLMMSWYRNIICCLDNIESCDHVLNASFAAATASSISVFVDFGTLVTT